MELDSLSVMAHAELGRALVQADRCADALNAVSFVPASFPNYEGGVRGFASARCGRHREAAQIIEDLKADTAQGKNLERIAMAYAGLGDREGALAWLERAYEARSLGLIFLRVEPIYDAVRGEARFIRLVEKIGRTPRGGA